jgi:hypothetical protein
MSEELTGLLRAMLFLASAILFLLWLFIGRR